MAESEVDFNNAIDDIFLSEENQHQKSYQEGFKAGSEAGNPEGYHLGYHKGAEIGKEIGYYLGVVTHHLALSTTDPLSYNPKICSQLNKVKELIDSFPLTNSEDHDLVGMLETVRAQYKKACALLKIPSTNPYSTGVSF